MKNIKTLVLNTCLYSILILLVAYIFLGVYGSTAAGIQLRVFLVVLGYGLLISTANLIYNSWQIHPAIKTSLHFAMLFIGFIAVYATLGMFSGATAAKIFIAVSIFLLAYIFIRVFVWLTKRQFLKHLPTSKPAQAQRKKKAEYKPLYSEDDK